jgi:hypothetical protein
VIDAKYVSRPEAPEASLNSTRTRESSLRGRIS